MEGSNFTRLCRLTNYLLSHPTQIPKYFKYSVTRQTPMDLGLPWISNKAIEFLDKWKINENTEILELGGGGSTIYFGKRKAHVTCLESSLIWAEKLSTKCGKLNLTNVDIRVLEYDCSDINLFLQSDFYQSINQSINQYMI
jgi:hypothetical protein